MKKEFVDVDKEKGIVRVTTQDERWYTKPSKSVETGLPNYDFYPSATWIVHYYYTSPYLIEWIAKKGLDEAEAIKQAAGQKGSKIHQGTEILDKGGEIKIGDRLMNWDKDTMEELSFEEYDALIAYKNYFEKNNVQVLANEMTVFYKDSQGRKAAGTLDKIIAIPADTPTGRQIFIQDIKTSKAVADGHRIQISFYSHCDIDHKSLGITDEEWTNRKLCILQLAYRYNRDKYKWTEVEDCFEDFIEVCYRTWKKYNNDATPSQIYLPLSIKLTKVGVNNINNNKTNDKVSKNNSVTKSTQRAIKASKEAQD